MLFWFAMGSPDKLNAPKVNPRQVSGMNNNRQVMGRVHGWFDNRTSAFD